MGETRDPRSETLKVRSETQDPGPISWVGPETRDPGLLFYVGPETGTPGQ